MARQKRMEARLDGIAMQMDQVLAALQGAGLGFPTPSQMNMTVLPSGDPASTPVFPPIVLTPCTPANTQEAAAYALTSLQPPSQGSIPPVNAAEEPEAEGVTRDVDGDRELAGDVALAGDAGGQIAERVMGVSTVGSESVVAGTIDKAGGVEDAETVDEAEAGAGDEAGTPDEAGTVDEAAQKEMPVSPATATGPKDFQIPPQQVSVQPPPPPASQSTLQPPAPPLPSLSSPRTHTPAPSHPGPQLSPMPGQASRRSPRLQLPIVASPKEKRPRPDDEGRGASKRRKE